MDTREIELFHGTSAYAGRAIFCEGARDFLSEVGAKELAHEIWPIILNAAGSFPQTANLFTAAGSDFPIGAPTALQNVFDSYDRSTFAYGIFYVSTNLMAACRYVLRSITGSELLLMIAEAIKVLRWLSHPLGDQWSKLYPELAAVYEKPKHPIILVLTNVEEKRLFDENGGPPNLNR